MMHAFYTLMISALLTVSPSANDRSDDFIRRWAYPSNSAGGVGKFSSTVVFSRSARRTTDSVEKVVLWYSERVGLTGDHSLVEAAKNGFSDLESRLNIHSSYGHDTKEKRDHLSILGTITAKHAHVTMIYQPNLAKKTDVVISITQTPDGTNIHVLRQEPNRTTER
jgi:hypothetical protein